jgi:hypothetical protein
MNRSDFTGLPTSVALGVLWDHIPELRDRLADVLVPKVPFPPKWDTMIFRSDGVQYASEMDVRGLKYFHLRSTESADKEYWIAWRLVEPTARWTGERNHETVTADAPSAKPTVHPRAERSTRTTTFDDAPSGPPVEDDDIPF